MKNLARTRNAYLVIAAAVPVGTVAGDDVEIGDQGLRGTALTNRVTTALLSDLDNNLPQGLADGQASVELTGISLSVYYAVTGDADLGDIVYKNGSGTYDLVDTGTPIGYALQDSPSANAVIEVGKFPFWPIPA